MTGAVVQPGATLAVPYTLSSPGWVAIHVTGEAPVDVYVVDADGRAEYERSDTFKSLVGSTNRRDHSLTATLPAGNAYLLIANGGDRAVKVYYELRRIYTGGPTGATGPSGSYGDRFNITP